jgi:periplasmic protein CpxP/Spy
MKSIRFRLMIATLAVLLGSTFAKSQTTDDAPAPPPMHGHHMGMGMEGHLHFMAAKLNLTDDQQSQMKAIMQKDRASMKPLHQQERAIDKQLREFVEGNFDEAKVQALAAQKAQIQAQLTVQETRTHNQLYQILNADQKSQLKQMEADHQARMQQRKSQKPPAPPETPEQ